jgi:hypothetical protein
LYLTFQGRNQLHGILPFWLPTLPQLSDLSIYINSFTGPLISVECIYRIGLLPSNWSSLVTCQFSDNYFTCPVPQFYGSMGCSVGLCFPAVPSIPKLVSYFSGINAFSISSLLGSPEGGYIWTSLESADYWSNDCNMVFNG